MLRHEPSRDHVRVPDRELGIAAVLLLLTVFLTVVLAPGIL
ncbi:MAG: hypothetical protein ACRDGD_02315 [Candidatus Limnocylindria bacterium]